MKLLIVDDEKDIRDLVKLYLANEAYEIIEAENGLEALKKMDESIDLVLADVMMPKLNGIQLCIEIRKNYNVPIIFLTAKTEDVDKLTGFSSGGDDYITKPFNPLDLLNRVKANLRRYKDYSPIPKKNTLEAEVGDLRVNFESHIVYKNDNQIKLTKTEFAILELFLKNRNRVYSLEEIYTRVWEEDCIMNSETTVSVHIRNLREKIEDDLSQPNIIKTVWGVGYRVD